jgi:hypothetical protein
MSVQKAKILAEFLEQKNKVLRSRNLKRFLRAKKNIVAQINYPHHKWQGIFL